VRMSRNVSVIELGFLKAIVKDVDDPEVELRNVANPRTTLKPIRPFPLPIDETGVTFWRKLLALRVGGRESVVTTDHLVPTGEELTEVVVVISIDTVSE